MRAMKLNKSQNWELIIKAVNNAVAETNTLKKGTDAEFAAQLLEQLDFLKPKQGGGSSTKVNGNGAVFCNYFGEYMEASEFNIKLGKPNKITGARVDVYKANCKEAELILRRLKTLKAKFNKQVMDNFRDKTITAEEMDKFLDNLDDALDSKFQDITEIPSITNILEWDGR